MKFDLVITSLPGLKKNLPAPGPTYIKSYLEPLGFKVKLIQGHMLDDLKAIQDEIKKYQYRWLGISVFSFLQIDDALKLAEPFDNVFFGGAGVDYNWPTENYIVGQGEHTLVEFLQGNFDFPGINGKPDLPTILEITTKEDKEKELQNWRIKVGEDKAKEMAMSTMKNTTRSKLKMIKEEHVKTNSIWQVYLKSPTGFITNGVITKGKPKPILVFNSASLCGFTEQLSQFEELFQSGKATPIAIPTNDFGQQEPGNDEEIIKHYKDKFGVTFPVLAKADLEHPFFKTFGMPTWNFNKYLFDYQHNFVKQYESKVMPMDFVKIIDSLDQNISEEIS
jgi:glutathione peroxidase